MSNSIYTVFLSNLLWLINNNPGLPAFDLVYNVQD